jgi:protein-S-isoprenylcysteine O-methyltransferase Ste14
MKTIETAPIGSRFAIRQRFIPSKAVLLDIVERTLIFTLYGQFAFRLMSLDVAALKLGSTLLVISETIPLFFLLIRRFSTRLSQDPFDWTIALIGASLPLMIVSNSAHGPLAPIPVCDSIIMLGLCIQIAAKVSLGRAFGIVAANRGVETTGPYRFVRHPMYLGYTITHIGFLLLVPPLLNLILYSLALCLQVIRLLREERLLNQDPEYQAFANRVRYRLVPGIF